MPAGTWVALGYVRLGTRAPVTGSSPSGTSLYVPELGQVPRDRVPYYSYIKVSTLYPIPFDLVQLRVNAAGQLGPVRVQAALPAGRVSRE